MSRIFFLLVLSLLACSVYSQQQIRGSRSNELDDLLFLNRGFARATAACEAGQLEEALDFARVVLEGRTEMLGYEHEDTEQARRLTAAILYLLGQQDEALQISPEYDVEICSGVTKKIKTKNLQ